MENKGIHPLYLQFYVEIRHKNERTRLTYSKFRNMQNNLRGERLSVQNSLTSDRFKRKHPHAYKTDL